MAALDDIRADLEIERRHLRRLQHATLHRPAQAIAACEKTIARLERMLEHEMAATAEGVTA